MPDKPAPTMRTSKCSCGMVSSAHHNCPPWDVVRQPATGARTQPAKRTLTSQQRSPGSLRGFASMIDEISVSVAVVVRLVRTFLLDADVIGLVLAELGELDADLGEMQARDLLVE